MRTSTTRHDEPDEYLDLHHRTVREREAALAAYDAVWDAAPDGQSEWETLREAALAVRDARGGEFVSGATEQGERQMARLAAAEHAMAYEGRH